MDIRTKPWMYAPESEYLNAGSSGDGQHDTLLEWPQDLPAPTAQDLADVQERVTRLKAILADLLAAGGGGDA